MGLGGYCHEEHERIGDENEHLESDRSLPPGGHAGRRSPPCGWGRDQGSDPQGPGNGLTLLRTDRGVSVEDDGGGG